MIKHALSIKKIPLYFRIKSITQISKPIHAFYGFSRNGKDVLIDEVNVEVNRNIVLMSFVSFLLCKYRN